jgi:AraC family transcriptional regulator
MSAQTSADRIELIDFGITPLPHRLSSVERIAYNGVIVLRCHLVPNPGVFLASAQNTVVIHESDPCDLEWRFPETEAPRQHRMVAGDLHIIAAERPLFLRRMGTAKALVIALEQAFIEQVARDAFNMASVRLRTMIAIRDPVIQAIAVAWRKEFDGHGSGGRLYSEGLGLALAVHLLRTYGDGSKPIPVIMGGLGAHRLQRVIDYIAAHLDQDIGLPDLAAIAGLSPHHFSDAFKVSTGMPPHHYLIDQRIRRAKELLLGTDRPVTEIALEVGFASHSHFTDQFRKRTNTTPMRYRMDRR